MRLRRTIYIDIDPVRSRGISATDAEKRAARDARERVEEFLVRELGDPAALGRGDSANGCFMLIAIHRLCLTILNHASHVQRFLKLLAREELGARSESLQKEKALNLQGFPGCAGAICTLEHAISVELRIVVAKESHSTAEPWDLRLPERVTRSRDRRRWGQVARS